MTVREKLGTGVRAAASQALRAAEGVRQRRAHKHLLARIGDAYVRHRDGEDTAAEIDALLAEVRELASHLDEPVDDANRPSADLLDAEPDESDVSPDDARPVAAI